MKDKIKGDTLLNIGAAILFIMHILRLYTEKMENFIDIFIYLLGAVLLYQCLCRYRINTKMIQYYIVIVVLALINILFIGNISYIYIIRFSFGYIPLALFFLNCKILNRNVWLISVAFIMLFIEISWLTSADTGMLFHSTSRNYVSLFALIALWIVMLYYHQINKKVPIGIVFCVVIVCISAIGRSGILCSIGMFGLILLERVLTSKKKRNAVIKATILILSIILSMLIISFYTDEIVRQFFPRFVDSTVAESDMGRLRIIYTYFKYCTSSTNDVLFGVSLEKMNSSILFMDGNLHNSYLQLHACLGIGGVVLMIIALIRTTKYLIQNSEFEKIIFLVTFLVRFAFDFCAAGYIGDVVLIYYILLPLIDENSKYRKIHLHL